MGEADNAVCFACGETIEDGDNTTVANDGSTIHSRCGEMDEDMVGLLFYGIER